MPELDFSQYLLGLDEKNLTATQMVVRAIIVYVSTVAMIRIGERRVLGKNTAFDVILGVVLGSSLSRAINGSADLGPTIIAGFVLIALHWLFAAAAFRFGWFGRLVKGRPLILIEDGEYQEKNLLKAHITRRDLEEASRRGANIEDPRDARRAYLERSGEISFILEEDEKSESRVRVVDVSVDDGIKTVRVELV